MKSFNLLYNELGIKVYYTTSWLRIQKRYDLQEGIDYVLKNNDILLNDNVFEHILNTYSKSRKLKDCTYLNTNQLKNNKENLNYIEEKIEDNKLKLKIKELTKENSILLEELDKLNEFKNIFYSSLLEKNDLNRIRNYKSIEHRDKSITPVFIYADLHYSQVIKKSHVYGYNEYNSDICERRVIDCTEQFINYYTNDIKTYKDRIIIAVLSDSINNEHHDSDNDKSIPEQIIGVSKLYIKCFNMIKNAFPNTKIDAIFTSSNHDRINMQYSKTPIKDCITNSYTYLIMNNIINAGYVIKWEDEGDWLENIYGNNVLFTHGHNFKINTKNHNSIINQLNKMNKQFMSCDKNGISLICCAHYHADVLTDKFIISCSPVGADPYAKSLGLPFYKPGLTSFAYNSNGEFCNYIVFRSNV